MNNMIINILLKITFDYCMQPYFSLGWSKGNPVWFRLESTSSTVLLLRIDRAQHNSFELLVILTISALYFHLIYENTDVCKTRTNNFKK